EVLENFQGGRVVIGVTSLPFKCPPAPSEAALLLHDFLTERDRRDNSEIALVTPQPAPIPPSPDSSAALLAAFAERGISFNPNRALKSVDPALQVALFDDGSEMPYDLLFGIPVHSVRDVVARVPRGVPLISIRTAVGAQDRRRRVRPRPAGTSRRRLAPRQHAEKGARSLVAQGRLPGRNVSNNLSNEARRTGPDDGAQS